MTYTKERQIYEHYFTSDNQFFSHKKDPSSVCNGMAFLEKMVKLVCLIDKFYHIFTLIFPYNRKTKLKKLFFEIIYVRILIQEFSSYFLF